MKKISFAYFLACALSLYILLSSYSSGPGTNGFDCTGAETGLGNPSGCTTCHGSAATSGISIAIELDSAGVPTTHYSGGKSYTVILTGTNNTSTVLPKYGFQMGSIKGSFAVVTPTNAGTWASPYPTLTHYAAPSPGNYVVGVVEHTASLSPTSGTGGMGTIYSQTFNWTAPASGTGTISIWAALNAVNANGLADTGDHWNKVHVIINEWSITGTANLAEESAEIKAYPNPVTDVLNLQMQNLPAGMYALSVFDASGRKIFSKNVEAGGTNFTETISATGWKRGMYKALIEKDNFFRQISIVK
ncbi:MAG: T9SS type A sorting domain-containing protein [Bacteroidetes bacterium]|nr:T9SS type A sorting domain-containing protein [Bacteroidota bacterium]